MNKTFIILLAVCLVSVHGFVRREAPAAAPATEKNYLEDIQKTLDEVKKQISEKAKTVLDPEELKKSLNSAVDTVSKAFDDLKKSIDSSTATEPKQ